MNDADKARLYSSISDRIYARGMGERPPPVALPTQEDDGSDDDPASPKSVSMRALFRGTTYGAKVAATMGPQFDTLPASAFPKGALAPIMSADAARDSRPGGAAGGQIPGQATELELRRVEEYARHNKAMEDARASPASPPAPKPLPDDKAYQLQRQKALDDASTPESAAARAVAAATPTGAIVAKRLGDAWNNVSGNQAAKLMGGKVAGVGSGKGRGGKNSNIDSSGTPDWAAMPGYDHDPKVGVQKSEALQLRNALSDGTVLKSSLDAMVSLVEKHGITLLPGDVKADMQGLAKDIAMKAKGPSLYQLGVLSGPDMAILEQIIGDPTSIDSYLKGGASALIARLQRMKTQASSSINSKLETRGYRRHDSLSNPASTTPPIPDKNKPAPKNWTVYNKNGFALKLTEADARQFLGADDYQVIGPPPEKDAGR